MVFDDMNWTSAPVKTSTCREHALYKTVEAFRCAFTGPWIKFLAVALIVSMGNVAVAKVQTDISELIRSYC
tara:strand:+ start:193 stop:405 length:213 start_codon:yes stop_codon:yes gene_type:complete